MIVTPDPIGESTTVKSNVFKVVMMDAPNVEGSLETEVGFDIKLLSDAAASGPFKIDFIAWSDEDLTTFSTIATLSDATVGRIASTEGNAVKVVTDDDCSFRCKLTMAGTGTVWLSCAQSAGSPSVHTTSVDTIVFS